MTVAAVERSLMRSASRMRSATNQAFEIFLVWSEVRITVAPDQTALSAFVDAGVPIEAGCMMGECGSWAKQFVEGDLIHKGALPQGCLPAGERA